MGVFFTLLYIVRKYSFRLIQNYPFQATWPRFSPIYSCLVIETKLFTFLHYATFISSLSSVFSVNSRKAEHERCHFSSSPDEIPGASLHFGVYLGNILTHHACDLRSSCKFTSIFITAFVSCTQISMPARIATRTTYSLLS